MFEEYFCVQKDPTFSMSIFKGKQSRAPWELRTCLGQGCCPGKQVGPHHRGSGSVQGSRHCLRIATNANCLTKRPAGAPWAAGGHTASAPHWPRCCTGVLAPPVVQEQRTLNLPQDIKNGLGNVMKREAYLGAQKGEIHAYVKSSKFYGKCVTKNMHGFQTNFKHLFMYLKDS